MFVFPDRTPVPQDPVASLASLVTMAPQIPQATLVQTLAELFSTLSQASTSNKTCWQLCHHRLPFPPQPSSQRSHIQEQQSRLQLLTTCFLSSWHLWSSQCLLYSVTVSVVMALYLWREGTTNLGGTSARSTSSCRTIPSRPLLLLTSITTWSRLWVISSPMVTTPLLLLSSSLAPAPTSRTMWPSLTVKCSSSPRYSNFLPFLLF